MSAHCPSKFKSRHGFSMIEVVLAIGIFLITVLALVGLLGPTLKSVEDVERTDEVASVVNTVNAFLQSSPDIAPGGSKFDAIFSAVQNGNFATLFVFREYVGDTNDIRLAVGFREGEGGEAPIDIQAQITDFSDAAGPIYRVVLTPSSVLPEAYRSNVRNANGVYELETTLAAYEEGYFAMEVRIFAEAPPGPGGAFTEVKSPADLSGTEPIFTYNTAIVR
ncbi:MAG: hypothetical protein EA353_10390 [Puniceicoccaceae bacterium]|nr:MAG: hypothetical protein EA353_10390 [Puniceicoccaceae bacterium]